MLYNELQIKGLSTELECEKKFIELGFIVSVPYGNNARYDFIVDTGKRFFKMQAKTGSKSKNDSYQVLVINTASNMKGIKKKRYLKEDVDFICSIIENQLVLIPIEFAQKFNNGITFRLDYPSNGNKTNIHLIKDFSFDKIMLPILEEDERPIIYSPHANMSKINKCPICGNDKSIGQKICPDCQKEKYLKDLKQIVSKEELKQKLRFHTSIGYIASLYHVSPKTLQRWCVAYGLPTIKKDVWNYSDEEWAKL